MFFLCLIMAVSVSAQMPRTLNYQGTLATGSTPVPDGNYNVTFRLYAASTGGSAVWTEAQLVSARNGVFNATLGRIVPLPASFNLTYWMSLQVGADPELSPRLELTGVSYSMHSAVADSATKVANGSVGSAALGTAAVTVEKILDASVTSAKIADNTITDLDILDEPGIEYAESSTYGTISTNPASSQVASIIMTIPAAGYVMVTACGSASFTTVGDNMVRLKVSTTANDVNETAGIQFIRLTTTSTYWNVPFNISRVFPVSTGTSTFYLNMYHQISPGTAHWEEYSLIGRYFPTRY
jgi:hypothetical protein